MAAKKNARANRPVPARKTPAKKTKAKKVDPVPKGMHTLTPLLTFKDASKALTFYKEAFGAKELYRLCEPSGKIGHAEIMIGNSLLMLAEEYADMSLYAPDHYDGIPMRLMVAVKDVDRTFAQAVAAGAEVTRAVETQFYGWRSGNLKDPFGYHWMVSSQVEAVSPKQMQKRWNKMFEAGSGA